MSLSSSIMLYIIFVNKFKSKHYVYYLNSLFILLFMKSQKNIDLTFSIFSFKYYDNKFDIFVIS